MATGQAAAVSTDSHASTSPSPHRSFDFETSPVKNPYYMAWLRQQQEAQEGNVEGSSSMLSPIKEEETRERQISSSPPPTSTEATPSTPKTTTSRGTWATSRSPWTTASVSSAPPPRPCQSSVRTPSQEPSPLQLPPLKRLRVFGPWTSTCASSASSIGMAAGGAVSDSEVEAHQTLMMTPPRRMKNKRQRRRPCRANDWDETLVPSSQHCGCVRCSSPAGVCARNLSAILEEHAACVTSPKEPASTMPRREWFVNLDSDVE